MYQYMNMSYLGGGGGKTKTEYTVYVFFLKYFIGENASWIKMGLPSEAGMN